MNPEVPGGHATHAPSFSQVPFALHTRTPLLPAALASVPFGFVLVRVRVRLRAKRANLNQEGSLSAKDQLAAKGGSLLKYHLYWP